LSLGGKSGFCCSGGHLYFNDLNPEITDKNIGRKKLFLTNSALSTTVQFIHYLSANIEKLSSSVSQK